MPRTSTAAIDAFEPSVHIPNKVGTVGDKNRDIAGASVARPRKSPSTSGAVDTSGAHAPFRVLKNWEGVVTSVDGQTFTAAMKETGAPRDSRPTDSFEIDLENVAEDDRALVAEGSVFYLTLGKISVPGEQMQKTTRLIFRRLPAVSKRDFQEAVVEAEELFALQQAAFEKQYPGEQVPKAEP